MHADKLNELIHFDFLFMSESDKDSKYCLVIKGDYSSFPMLTPYADFTSESAAHDLVHFKRPISNPPYLKI